MTSISSTNHTSFADKVGTGGLKLEKKVVDQAVEKVKEVAHKVSDSIKEVTKTPEGKAIVGGLVISPFIPVIGPALILGGVGATALKFIKNNSNNAAKEAGKAAGKAGLIAAGAAAGAAAGPVGALAGAAAGVAAGAVIGHKKEIKNSAKSAAESAAKAVGKGAAEVGKGLGKVGAKAVEKTSNVSFVEAAVTAAAIAMTPIAPIIGATAAGLAAAKIINNSNKK